MAAAVTHLAVTTGGTGFRGVKVTTINACGATIVDNCTVGTAAYNSIVTTVQARIVAPWHGVAGLGSKRAVLTYAALYDPVRCLAPVVFAAPAAIVPAGGGIVRVVAGTALVALARTLVIVATLTIMRNTSIRRIAV